jgi:DNA-directed RNA polymerase subunit RPC12/RpoP
MTYYYKEYEGKVINYWHLLNFSKRENKNTYFNAICLACNQPFEIIVRNVINGRSKSCRHCGYKLRKPKSTKPNYIVLNTITWSYEPTKTN